jgi:hypothetical protein
MRCEFSLNILEKPSSVRFYGDPCSGSRVIPCGGTDTTGLLVTFCVIAKALRKEQLFP